MTIQYPCEVCSEMWPENSLVLIEQTGKLTCPMCINLMIYNLLAEKYGLPSLEK